MRTKAVLRDDEYVTSPREQSGAASSQASFKAYDRQRSRLATGVGVHLYSDWEKGLAVPPFIQARGS